MSKKLYRVLVVTLSLLSSSYIAKATTFIAKASSTWTNNLTTWGTFAGPTVSDIVIIPNGFNVTVNSTTAVASTVTINSGGKLTISNGNKLTIGGALTNAGTITTNSGNLIIGGSLTNSGTMTVSANGSLTFDGASNSTISSSGGTYSIPGTVVMDMGTAATVLDVQDANFISGINSGGKYYLTLTRGTFKMDNGATLNNAYNKNSSTALTIPYNVVLESDNGVMNLASKGTVGNVILSGQLFINGGTVNVQMGQANNAGQDFEYRVNGGHPQLYISSGSLNIGAGFNPRAASDYIDFEMTGGTMLVSANGHTSNPTFRLQDVAGGKTVMSGGLIDIRNSTTGSGDLDMGGTNVASTLYAVTGGTVQLGDANTENDGDFWGIQAYPTTNYPHIDMEPGIDKTAGINNSGSINMLSLKLNTHATFDATQFTSVNITGNNSTYALDDEGTLTTGTIEFSGAVPQVITSTANPSVSIANLQVSNTSGNVVLEVPVTVSTQLKLASGKVDASAYSLTISNGANAITGMGNSSYVITGDGVTSTGQLIIQKLTKNVNTNFPVGTPSYYLPITLNPGNNANTAYSAFVYPGVTANAQATGTSLSTALLAVMADGTWSVARTAGSGSATLGLSWASAGTALEGSYFQGFGTDIGITQYSGGTWGTAAGTGNEATHTASASFTSFTQFSAIGTPVSLPISLAGFTAAPKGRTVALAWEAFPDGQPASFTIQRSPDGLGWTTIGVVQADASATTKTSYSYTDVSPAIGEDYYRLYIQNADGSSSYSPVRTVAFAQTAQVSVYPNPANAALTITIGSSNRLLAIRLVNTAGMVLQSRIADAGATTLTMNTGTYPTGIYYVETLDGGQLLQTTAVMVAH